MQKLSLRSVVPFRAVIRFDVLCFLGHCNDLYRNVLCAVLYVCSQGRAFAGPAQGRVRASLPRVGGFRH